MDGDRFDDITRRFARGTSRRGVLKGIAGSVVGGLATLLGRSPAGAVRQADCGNVVCTGEPEVCNDGCVCCVWSNGNSRCMPPKSCQRMNGDVESSCADNKMLCNGDCIDENACCPVCDSGVPCIDDVCCTSGVYDIDAGLCCAADQQICNGVCIAGGTCCISADCAGNLSCGPQGCFCDTNEHAHCGDTCCDTGDVCCTTGDGCTNGCCPEANLCGDVCFANFDSDPDNCGRCGNPCDTANGETCQGGTCVAPCDDIGKSCSGPGDCCAGSECSDSLCCAAGWTNCGGACVDPTSDPDHCGDCHGTCLDPADGHAACVNSACVVTSCDDGFSLCDYGCCANDKTCCNGSCTDTQEDADHCGGCDTECPAPPFGQATCTGGTCGHECDDGYSVCGDFCCPSSHACCDDVCCGEGATTCDGQTGACINPCGALQSTCVNVDACCPSYDIDCGLDANGDKVCCHNPGGTCSSAADCCVVDGYDVACQDGICGGAGAQCESWQACASEACCDDACCAENEICSSNGCKLAIGAACSTDDECGGGLCCDNICASIGDRDSCGDCGIVCDADEDCYTDGGCLKREGGSCTAADECTPGHWCLDNVCCRECGWSCGDAGPHWADDYTYCAYGESDGICCSGGCINPASNRDNCGACGINCPVNFRCFDGVCGQCAIPTECNGGVVNSRSCEGVGSCERAADGANICVSKAQQCNYDTCSSNADCSDARTCVTLGCCNNGKRGCYYLA